MTADTTDTALPISTAKSEPVSSEARASPVQLHGTSSMARPNQFFPLASEVWTVRAYAVERFGNAPEILDLPKPTTADGYVVGVTDAGVNPVDYKLVDRLTPQSEYPFVLGVDFAGILEEVPAGEREGGVHGKAVTHT